MGWREDDENAYRTSEDMVGRSIRRGTHYGRLMPDWKKNGYRVKLIFLRLPTVDVAIARVAARVAHGGHAIPEDVIRRRFDAGWRNFTSFYRSLVDVWQVYDNSGDEPILLEQGP